MSIENEIAGLTQSTTDLLEAVNTKKATLDTAVSNAQTAVTDATSQVSLAAAEKVGAQTARDEAETHKNQAYTYSQSAASAVAYQDLTAIAQTKAESAVDVFVYDTSKDSDGGAWRQRTQHTSWYNEPLNTSTRGSRKEFPAVAVIVAESTKVIIYDGDDPSLPMWMVFGGQISHSKFLGFSSAGGISVTMLNGKLCFGTTGITTNGSINAVCVADYAADTLEKWDEIGYAKSHQGVVDRNDVTWDGGLGWYNISKDTSKKIVNQYVNDVAMTVLPDAPIDQATGLPIPTIAVATDGGVSVIKDDGSVVDSADTYSVGSVNFDNNNFLWYPRNGGSTQRYSQTYDADGWRGRNWQADFPLAFPSLSFETYASSTKDHVVLGSGFGEGLSRLDVNKDSEENSMVAYTTSKYNTGWMNGDIKLATLSDTDDTDLVGSELVTNGTFDTDISGWTGVNSTLSVVSGKLRVTSAGGDWGDARQDFSVVAGKTYVITIGDMVENTGEMYWAISGSGVNTGFSNEGTKTATFTPTSTGLCTITLRVSQTAGDNSDYDNISVRLAEPDRSVNNNGLQVFGTVQKNPVATGADLVAYSGFSSSNYLEQPYNSDLDFGTGDFCVMGWVKIADTGSANKNIMRWQGDTGLGAWRFRSKEGKLALWVSDDGVNTIREVVGSSDIDNNNWAFVSVVRSGDLLTAYVNGTLENTSSLPSGMDLSSSDAVLYVGVNQNGSEPWLGSLALLRISGTAPTAEQIAKIYRDEKVLFQEGAQATLHGTSDAVTALAYDTDTELLHVGTSAGRSVFQGLKRVDNTTDAVGTAISASNNLVVEE